LTGAGRLKAASTPVRPEHGLHALSQLEIATAGIIQKCVARGFFKVACLLEYDHDTLKAVCIHFSGRFSDPRRIPQWGLRHPKRICV
jgi:hypothetical protein